MLSKEKKLEIKSGEKKRATQYKITEEQDKEKQYYVRKWQFSHMLLLVNYLVLWHKC